MNAKSSITLLASMLDATLRGQSGRCSMVNQVYSVLGTSGHIPSIEIFLSRRWLWWSRLPEYIHSQQTWMGTSSIARSIDIESN